MWQWEVHCPNASRPLCDLAKKVTGRVSQSSNEYMVQRLHICQALDAWHLYEPVSCSLRCRLTPRRWLKRALGWRSGSAHCQSVAWDCGHWRSHPRGVVGRPPQLLKWSHYTLDPLLPCLRLPSARRSRNMTRSDQAGIEEEGYSMDGAHFGSVHQAAAAREGLPIPHNWQICFLNNTSTRCLRPSASSSRALPPNREPCKQVCLVPDVVSCVAAAIGHVSPWDRARAAHAR